ncbi:DUF371 domain-containing protein [Candidatus Woesearchaeota archaeon]|nr:DUF371 domain-containing protein [Candidatus Woesearchaeota archaeon]
MYYKFNAYGHPNILGTHKTTLEFTKDDELSLRGDCIAGVNADFSLPLLKKFIKSLKNKQDIMITIQTISKPTKIKETIYAKLNPEFNSNKEFVIRKTDFVSERTFAIRADKAAFELNKQLIDFLKDKNSKISIILNKI